MNSLTNCTIKATRWTGIFITTNTEIMVTLNSIAHTAKNFASMDSPNMIIIHIPTILYIMILWVTLSTQTHPLFPSIILTI